MNEYNLIKTLFGGTDGVKDLFKSDAQIIEINGQKWAVTCDTFSLEEDLFTSENPYLLGRNLAVATIGDLTASGAEPAFYMHSITLAKDTKEDWIKEVARGISDILKQVNCVLIGGDMGRGASFSYTGIALGRQVKEVSRIFPPVKQNLYVTGPLGDANIAALNGAPTPEFELRKMPANMLACIDTSGGFMDALWQLHALNLNFKIEAQVSNCEDLRSLFGGAGEYELLFSAEGEAANAIHIGTVTPNEKGVFLNGVEIKNPPPDPRGFDNLQDYIKEVSKTVYELFR
ncbi:thiamine-monophosphate kinase [Elusimicrobium posterum]|uniref:thiamine-phosphate kinase n=1 Tax=Elusimicrobium posterum TaxID=3116653 RepID=UPI003C71C6CB